MDMLLDIGKFVLASLLGPLVVYLLVRFLPGPSGPGSDVKRRLELLRTMPRPIDPASSAYQRFVPVLDRRLAGGSQPRHLVVIEYPAIPEGRLYLASGEVNGEDLWMLTWFAIVAWSGPPLADAFHAPKAGDPFNTTAQAAISWRVVSKCGVLLVDPESDDGKRKAGPAEVLEAARVIAAKLARGVEHQRSV